MSVRIKVYAVIALLLLAACSQSARAETISIEEFTLPEAISMNSVFFAGASQGYIVGNDGKIALTTDAGKNWSVIKLSTTAQLRGIYFYDKNNGWAVGDSGVIFHTQDGGYKWALQKSTVTDDLESVWFVSGSHGWATFKKAEKGRVGVQTFDGGESWRPFNIPCSTSFFRPKIEFDGSVGRMTGKIDEKKLKYFRTDDKGAKWQVATEDIYRPKQVGGTVAPLTPYTDYWPRVTSLVDNKKEAIILSEENKFYSYDKEMKKWIAGEKEGIGMARLGNGAILEIETESTNCPEKTKEPGASDVGLKFCFKQSILYMPKEGLNVKLSLPDMDTDGPNPLGQYILYPLGANSAIAFADSVVSKTVKLIKAETSSVTPLPTAQ